MFHGSSLTGDPYTRNMPTMSTSLASTDRDVGKYVASWVDYQVRSRRLPGASILLACAGTVLTSSAHGLANAETSSSLTTKHYHRIASHSKMFTATAVMLLVESRRLRLDDPITDWLPWLPDTLNHSTVTVRDLLNHTGGILRDGLDSDYWALKHPFPSEDDLRHLISTVPLVFPPNQQFKYSNIGFGLLGLIVEAASHQRYNDFVVSTILQPLEMHDTGPDFVPGIERFMATGYSADRPDSERTALPHVPTHALAPATGFYSTPEDLYLFAMSHCFGGRSLLSDDSKRVMQHASWSIAGSPQQYGLGIYHDVCGGIEHVGHSGGFPGFSTSTRFDPVNKHVAVACINSTNGAAEELTAGLLSLLGYALKHTTQAPESRLDFPASTYTGRFAGHFQVRDIIELNGHLVSVHPADPDPIQSLATLTPISKARLRIAEDSGYASVGEEVVYDFDADGNATSIRWAGSTLTRIDD